MAFAHGGDIEGYIRRFGRVPLDFSANVSPIGLPERVKAAAIDALERADEYPDPLCRKLTEKIAAIEGVKPESVLCGAGSADIIYRLALALRPRAALLTAPTFSEYESALRAVRCRADHHLLNAQEGFALSPRILDVISGQYDMMFLCQPNNPTGRLVEPGLLNDIFEMCRDCGIILVADECFVDFLDEPEKYSLQSRLNDYGGLIILKTFTKMYAMPGLRLGYGICSDSALIERLREAGQSWAVSNIAQAAGIAVADEGEYAREVKALVRREKEYLIPRLQAAGLDCIGSAVNYVFVFSHDPLLHTKLLAEGIMIRDCSNYVNLGEGYYRIAIRRHEDNVRLVSAVEHLLRV